MKKVSLFVLVSLLTTLFPTSLLAQSASFEDVFQESLDYDAIQYLQSEQIVEGYADGTFKPDNRINRAEFTKIIIGSLYEESEINSCLSSFSLEFPDVDIESWYAPYVCQATKEEIVSGYPDGTFGPDKKINFAESSKILANSFQVEDPELSLLPDNLWYAEFVDKLSASSVIPSTVDSADVDLTRGQMSEMVYRLKEDITTKPTQTLSNLTNQVGSITSCDALLERFQDRNYYPYMPVEPFPMMEFEMEESMSDDSATASMDLGGGGGELEFSNTNIQEEGVDEPDVVKTNGTHIYTINSNYELPSVQITQASGPELDLQSSILFNETRPTGLFLKDEKLVVLTSSDYWGYYPLAAESDESVTVLDSEASLPVTQPEDQADTVDFDIIDGAPTLLPYRASSQTGVYIFDISNPQSPDLIRELSVDGNYQNARMLEDRLVLISSYTPYAFQFDDITGEDLLPQISYDDQASEAIAECTDIRYLSNHSDMTFMIVSSLDTSSDQSEANSEVLIASSSDLYASKNNLYLTQPKYNYSRFTDLSDSERVTTNIFKFGLDSPSLSLKGVMAVPGTPLNQFSMSEYQDNFRIATTINSWDGRNSTSTNNLYVFDESLNRVGVLEGLAEGERVYSTRFIGNRAYMVTFRQVDPLFVIDISNPNNPTVLGELKIPGFSDYLHPYDQDHILGFGKEATLDGQAQGLKVSLFNVKDPTNPEELHTFKIGDRGTYSELLYNHKALLFSKEKNTMAFPITIYKNNTPSLDSWGDLSFVGAVNLGLNLEDGFSLKGQFTHLDEEINPESPWNYDSNQTIQRLIYIGDNLYTISNDKIQSHPLDSDETLNSIQLINQ